MKRRLCLAVALAALALPACQRPETVPAPPGLLPAAQLANLLVEMHLLESRVENTRLSPDSARALFLNQQKNLLWQSSITDSQFVRSYRYYSVHGKDLDDIYAAVLDTLGQREYRLGRK